MSHLNVNEIFGPTIQGEGIHAGRLVGFLRLAGCNLACSWCDTPYSWDWDRFDKRSESHRWDIADVVQVLDDMAVERVVVTGGEPMLQQKGIVELAKHLPMIDFEIETNGTIAPNESTNDAVALYTVSPKLSHAGDELDKRLNVRSMAAFAERAWDGQAVFKFVVGVPADLDEVYEIVSTYKLPRETVWVMPEGFEIASHLKHLQDIADHVVMRGWNLTTRLHLLAWGSKRGV